MATPSEKKLSDVSHTAQGHGQWPKPQDSDAGLVFQVRPLSPPQRDPHPWQASKDTLGVFEEDWPVTQGTLLLL